MYIHELNPIAFSLFNFKIYWYSLSYLFGFIFSYFYVKYILSKDFVNISFKIFEDFLGWAVIGVVIGGRIGYVIFYNLNFYLDDQSIDYLCKLNPLNLYGWSKHIIDRYIMNQVYYKKNFLLNGLG